MSADHDLVDAVLADHPGAFERLVCQYQALVGHIVFRLVRNAEDARELCQETFLRVHRQLHQFRHDSPLKSWIGRVAYSIALRHLEKYRIRIETLDARNGGADASEQAAPDTDLEVMYAEQEIAVRVRGAVDALPAIQRMLVCLYHLEEITIAEIGEITGLPVGTIKSHLFRGRRQLRLLLEDHTGESHGH